MHHLLSLSKTFYSLINTKEDDSLTLSLLVGGALCLYSKNREGKWSKGKEGNERRYSY